MKGLFPVSRFARSSCSRTSRPTGTPVLRAVLFSQAASSSVRRIVIVSLIFHHCNTHLFVCFTSPQNPAAQGWRRGQTVDGKTMDRQGMDRQRRSGITCAVRLPLEPLQRRAAEGKSRKLVRHRHFGSKNGGIVPRLVSRLPASRPRLKTRSDSSDPIASSRHRVMFKIGKRKVESGAQFRTIASELRVFIFRGLRARASTSVPSLVP